MAYSKLIELCYLDGTVDSIITAELSNWNSKAIEIPRIEIASCKREDIIGTGVCFLLCKEDDGTDSVYIGEAENVKERLVQHMRDYQSEKEKYYWTTAVIFVGRDLVKASIRYLEHQLVQMARKANRYTVLTKDTYANTKIKESHVGPLDEFISNTRFVMNALGYKLLEPVLGEGDTASDDDLLSVHRYGPRPQARSPRRALWCCGAPG